MSETNINALLLECGLNKTEQKIFLELFSRKQSTAGHLSKITNLKRSTVYSALDNLMQIGIVSKHKKGKVTLFTSSSKETFETIISNQAITKIARIQEAACKVAQQLSEYEDSVVQNLAGFNISVIDSVQTVYAILEETLISKNYQAIMNPSYACTGKAKKIVESFLERTSKTKSRINEIVTPGEVTEWYKKRIKNPNHNLKVLPKNINIITDMIMFDNCLLITNYDSNGANSIKIEQPEFYMSMDMIFKLLWETI